MAGHVSSRKSREQAINAGEAGNPSHRAHTQESDFSYHGIDSIPRHLPSLYVSPVPGTRISLEPRNALHTISAEQSSNDAHLAENYTLGGSEWHSEDAGERIARALRAMTFDHMADDLGEENSREGAYGCDKFEAERDLINETPNRKDGGAYHLGSHRVGSHREPNTTIRHKPIAPKNATESDTERCGEVLPENNMKLTANTYSSEDDGSKLDQSHAGTDDTDPSKVTRSFLDEHTLADTAYRKSCFLCLGSWNAVSQQDQAIRPKSPIGSLPLSELSRQSIVNWNTVVTTCATGESSSSGSRGQGRKSSNVGSKSSEPGQGQGSRAGKEKRLSGDSGDQNEDGDSGGKRLKGNEISPTRPTKRFACPFRKHDPAYYSVGRGYRACVGPGFKDISRLKEHLYRVHVDPITCPRCQATFTKQDLFDHHLREKVRCEEQPPKPSKGITSAIKEELRKKTPVPDPREKWCEIYRLLFKCESVPSSPYFDAHIDRDFNDFAERHMFQVLGPRLSPLFDKMNATSEQRAQFMEEIALDYKEMWESYVITQDADKQVGSDGSDTDSHLENANEPPWTIHAPNAFQWSDINFQPRQTVQNAANRPETPCLPSLFSLPQPATPHGAVAMMPASGRPVTPYRGNSYQSDSTLGTSSICDQCNDVTWHRCLIAANSPNWTTGTSLLPAFSPIPHPELGKQTQQLMSTTYVPYSGSADFSSHGGRNQEFEDFLQNYCGHETLHSPSVWPQQPQNLDDAAL